MKNICLTLSTIVFFLMLGQVCADIKIGIVGDQTGTDDMDSSYAAFAEGCKLLSNENLDIVLHVGDIVESAMVDGKIKDYFKLGTGYLSGIRNSKNESVPWYVTAGDHDVNPPVYQPGSMNYSKEILYRTLLQTKYDNIYKGDAPKLGNSLYYSFNFKDYHFISLFSEEVQHVDPRWGNIFMAKIPDDQYEWLKHDLNKIDNTKPIIVFIHQPLWYNWSGWLRVHKLLRRYNVLAVIAGHFHYNQTEGHIDGIKYIVVGATGGRIKNASSNAGHLWHVSTLKIDYDFNMEFKIIPLKNFDADSFSSRKNMDRVQALSSMLSMVSYKSQNTNDTVNSTTNQILGNPIDIPVDIYVNTDLNHNNSWSFHSTLKPGIGVWASNLSSVTLKNNQIPLNVLGVKVIFKEERSQNKFWIQRLMQNKDASLSTSTGMNFFKEENEL